MMFIFRRKHIKTLKNGVTFYSERYRNTTTARKGFKYDGATVVADVDDIDGAIHDWNFFIALWDDGTPMTFEEANWNYIDWLIERRKASVTLWDKLKYGTVSITRRALSIVGRPSWSSHRRREMVFDNMKFVYALRENKR